MLISKILLNLAALLYADNTDLNMLNLSNKSIYKVITEAQNLLKAFYFILRVLGRELKLEKCF